MKAHSAESQSTINPDKALQFLKEGNARFINNLKVNRDLLEQVNDTRDGQWPFAIILSCIDSRTSAELIFDQGLGDVFSVRIAGNILNEDILGSMEFATKVVGSKIIVVLGHSKCGAVRGACDHIEMGNLTTLLNKIQPAVYEEKSTLDNRTSKNAEFVEKVASLNVKLTMERIKRESVIIRELEEAGTIKIVGGMYDVDSGKVDFYE
ncbi:MAG: carbonic anhydrase [Saprospiraceae bacterium]|nr:carbonic anhydrase [Saprospiraceae bacterium]MBK8080233.1 carbonic anhydrase [Saprospiraceae bacterium]MBK8373168.1 carbonic anhydrase [Saprospiraceae bacterium]MBP6695601.1 carbonic anhydrase [Saprospiraceae bacterium]